MCSLGSVRRDSRTGRGRLYYRTLAHRGYGPATWWLPRGRAAAHKRCPSFRGGHAGVGSSRHNRTRLARGANFFTSGRKKGQRRLQPSASQSLLRIQCRHLPARSVPLCARVCELWLRLPRGGTWPVPGGQKGITALPGKELGLTPIRLDRMLQLLRNYGDRDAATRIADGFRFGFRLGFKGERVAVDARKLISAKQHARELMAKLLKEIKLGRIVGPFTTPPISKFRFSPVGVVPKKTPGDFRMIKYLSAPRGASVNDHIDPQECGVNYSTFDDAVDLITRLGQGAFMGKADIQSAFRLLPVHPDDFELLSMRINGLYYYDRCLPMGCSASCAIFERFSTFLEYCRQIADSECILHYLDDFFFAASTQSACSKLMRSFSAMCERFGVPVADDKTIGPVRSIEYLGLVINSTSFEVQVPVEKVRTLQADIAKIIGCEKVSLRSLQSLIGKLNFVCRAVTPGRAFLRRLVDLTRGACHPHHNREFSIARDDWDVKLCPFVHWLM